MIAVQLAQQSNVLWQVYLSLNIVYDWRRSIGPRPWRRPQDQGQCLASLCAPAAISRCVRGTARPAAIRTVRTCLCGWASSARWWRSSDVGTRYCWRVREWRHCTWLRSVDSTAGNGWSTCGTPCLRSTEL